jgi:hypothetical protein
MIVTKLPLSRRFPRTSVSFLCASCRHQSSNRRTQQRLRVRPDATMSSSTGPKQDHIIFNPPPSAPSVYHTPSMFLPKHDRRRELLSKFSTHPAAKQQNAESKLPPALKEPYKKKYHLTPEDLVEIRRLRAEDPVKWSREKLAKKFDCSGLFIGIVCTSSLEHRERERQLLEDVKSKWGRRRREAREDRSRRRATWGMEE